jgi:hypothetical protein
LQITGRVERFNTLNRSCGSGRPDHPRLYSPISIEIQADLALNWPHGSLTGLHPALLIHPGTEIDILKHRCHYCHKHIGGEIHPYTLKLELFPAIEPSLKITAEQLEIDFESEFNHLIEMMQEMQESDLVKQENLTFISHSFTLCPDCRHHITAQLEMLRPPID